MEGKSLTVQLFNRDRDRSESTNMATREETRNLAGQYSQVVKDLTEKIHALPK